MTVSDNLAEGDIVTVLAVPALLVKGLPDREREFLLSLVGEDVTVVSDRLPGRGIEIQAFDAMAGMTHFLHLARHDVSLRQGTADVHSTTIDPSEYSRTSVRHPLPSFPAIRPPLYG